jgi:hypothetical protein
MGFFKVLGGIALGVGAVAAAPFTGGGSVLGAATLLGSLAGAGTVAAAVGAGAAGAAAGYALSKKEEEDRNADVSHAKREGMQAGEIVAKEKYIAKLKTAEDELQQLRTKFVGVQQGTAQWATYGQKIVAMFGVGLAVAYIDDHLSQEELDSIDEFVLAASISVLPSSASQAIKALQENPPTFEMAVRMAEKEGVPRSVIDAIIEAVAYADQRIEPQERQLLSEWKQMTYSVN